MSELEQARKERDEAFDKFMCSSAKSTKYDVAARSARHKYMMASATVRALERDLLAFPVQNEKNNS